MPRKPEIHPARAEGIAALLEIARENPYWQFETEDICAMMNLTDYTASMLKRSDESPFSNDRSRPERVQAFFDKHPGWKPASEK